MLKVTLPAIRTNNSQVKMILQQDHGLAMRAAIWLLCWHASSMEASGSYNKQEIALSSAEALRSLDCPIHCL
jgi:hypothetical protein